MIIDSKVPAPTTPEIVFLKGSVSLWNYSIPFFTCNVPLSFAASNFKLFEELPQSDTGEWTLEELFQRDILWERVDNEILPYLKSPTRPQFFNALTVALLPGDTDSLGGDFGEPVDMPPIPDAGLGKPLMIGGVQLQYYGSDVDVPSGAGKMRWATERVNAVAVDGQHRLAAIKRFVAETKRERWGTASVPVIFLVADERVGFRTPHGTGEHSRTVSTLRSVFIDLNKNAKPVSATRNILLDDLDLASVCTRSLIGRSLGDGLDPERVPLSLVDWLTDRNKIEDGPFLTTVTLLHEATKQLLQVPDLQMGEDDNTVRTVERWIEATLPIDESAAREDVLAQVRECARLQTRLSWLPAHIRTLQQSFESTWRSPIRKVFREYAPYDRLWSYAETKDLLGPEFVSLYMAREIMPTKAGQARSARLIEAARRHRPGWTIEGRYDEPLAHIESTLKSDKWGFKVVYQRAMFRALAAVLRSPGSYLPGERSRDDAAAALVEAVNKLDAEGLGAVFASLQTERFWAGSGLSAEDTIEFTNAGAERLKSWLEVTLIVRAHGAEAPAFEAVGDWTGPAAQRLQSLLAPRSNRAIFKGMEKLATARGFEGKPDAPIRFMRQRYDHLRLVLR